MFANHVTALMSTDPEVQLMQTGMAVVLQAIGLIALNATTKVITMLIYDWPQIRLIPNLAHKVRRSTVLWILEQNVITINLTAV